MTVSIEAADMAMVGRIMAEIKDDGLTPYELDALKINLVLTAHLWVGLKDDKLVCAWGLIPPTLLSSTAYLWLYTTEAVQEYSFLFIRHSQLMVERMLEEYPTIVGTADPKTPNTIRWLKWLGAVFSEPQGKYIPFTIRKK